MTLVTLSQWRGIVVWKINRIFAVWKFGWLKTHKIRNNRNKRNKRFQERRKRQVSLELAWLFPSRDTMSTKSTSVTTVTSVFKREESRVAPFLVLRPQEMSAPTFCLPFVRESLYAATFMLFLRSEFVEVRFFLYLCTQNMWIYKPKVWEILTKSKWKIKKE